MAPYRPLPLPRRNSDVGTLWDANCICCGEAQPVFLLRTPTVSNRVGVPCRSCRRPAVILWAAREGPKKTKKRGKR